MNRAASGPNGVAMDGHGPRIQTGIARNTSRKDGIRAGAVSGPWRSQPVAEAPVAPRADAGAAPYDETRYVEPFEPAHEPGPAVVRRSRVEDGRTGRGIVLALVVATMFAGVAWWLTGTESWQAIAPETEVAEPWLGDVAGGGIEQVSDEELARAERAWIERTTPGAPEATVVPEPVEPAVVAAPEAPEVEPPVVAPVEPEVAVVEEVMPEPVPVPVATAPSLLRLGGPAPVAVPSIGREGPADYAGAAEGVVPSRIGPMPHWARAPAFRLADPEGMPPASGRIVVWVPG